MSVQKYKNIREYNNNNNGKPVYRLRIPLSGGKAGKGKARTSNVQVLDLQTNLIVKKFQFKTAIFASMGKAVNRAISFVLDQLEYL